MPITKALIGDHVCIVPSAQTLIAHGYLIGTEWTCDYCDAVHVLALGVGMAAPYWEVTEPEVPLELGPDVAE